MVVCMQACPSVYMCVPVCMHVRARMCTRPQPPSPTPGVPSRRGSSQLSGYGSAGSPSEASPPAPCKHLAGPGWAPRIQAPPGRGPPGIQRGGGFQGTKLTLALGFPLLEGPPRDSLCPTPPRPPARSPPPSLPPRDGVGWLDTRQPHRPGQACSRHRPGAWPLPSRDGLDSGARAR